jgi:uncharacterized protein (TIGR00369 family)
MTRAATLLNELRESGDFGPLIATIPYARYLGLHVDVVDGDPITRLHGDAQLVGNPVLPALHGGTVGALLESAAIFKLIWEGTSAAVPKTINITIDYLRSARVVDTFARASVTKHGRRVVNVQVRAWQAEESKPIAAAHAHFLVKTDAP